MKLLTRLQTLSIPGLFAFRNDKDKKIYIASSNNCLLAISQMLKNLNDKLVPIKEMYRDRKKLEVCIIETVYDRIERDVRFNYWCDYYRNLGYSLYREHTGVKYRVRTDIETVDGNNRVFVKLVNTRGDKLVVGVFDSVDNAEEFIKLKYNTEYIVPVYSDNELTKEYLKRIS